MESLRASLLVVKNRNAARWSSDRRGVNRPEWDLHLREIASDVTLEVSVEIRMKQELPKKTTIYKAWFVDHYEGWVREIPGGPWTGRAHAENAIQSYFEKNPVHRVTDYDVGGYVEEIQLDVGFNPRE